MKAEHSYRGWIVAFAVAGIVTYFLLAAERDSRLSRMAHKSSGNRSATNGLAGIWVHHDPSAELLHSSKPAPLGPVEERQQRGRQALDADSSSLLSAAPEPVATVVLHAPTAIPEMVAITLSDARQTDELVSAIDRAFDSPMRTVALQKQHEEPQSNVDSSRIQDIAPRGTKLGELPEPVALFNELKNLREQGPSMKTVAMGATSQARAVQLWVEEVDDCLRRVVYDQGLLDARTKDDLESLLSLSARAHELAQESDNYELATKIGCVAYGVERRVRVWQSVADCLSADVSAVAQLAPTQVKRDQLRGTVENAIQTVQKTQDAKAWNGFLRLDDLASWTNLPDAGWKRGNELATQVIARMQWERLTPQQKEFLAQPIFKELNDHLAPWAVQPIDFRQLLTDVEQLEDDPINRCRASLAQTVQALRVSPQTELRSVAAAINDHYRNANIRLAISGKLLERLMPNDTFTARPVRQRILGADTKGNSQVRTTLKVNLIPDATAWHLQLGMLGDMTSATQSSKGPAVFHQTSIAQIHSARTLRMDPSGLKVSADPTNVDTRNFLNGMSTDLDRLPVVGDFFRAMVREQFEQQRGVAQRITKRIIAEETDHEVDKQLKTQLSQAESQLQHTFIGPLERLKLNPIVVSMNTTEERLTVRYRVANESQMAAHTARPRAPGDSLVSMQIHQSAINNALAQLGLSDRDWTIPDLCKMLADVFDQPPWNLPEDVPQDLTVRFAPTRPITVELRDGKLELTLRIAELNHPERRMTFQRFIVKATYVPSAKGMEASLVRESVVSIDGPRLGMAEKVPLRGIFGTVFSAESKIQLINSHWLEDPRAKGLAVSQVEVRDGWLSIAVSDESSPNAARVAEATAHAHPLR